jgi:hypothetical protein
MNTSINVFSMCRPRIIRRRDLALFAYLPIKAIILYGPSTYLMYHVMAALLASRKAKNQGRKRRIMGGIMAYSVTVAGSVYGLSLNPETYSNIYKASRTAYLLTSFPLRGYPGVMDRTLAPFETLIWGVSFPMSYTSACHALPTTVEVAKTIVEICAKDRWNKVCQPFSVDMENLSWYHFYNDKY